MLFSAQSKNLFTQWNVGCERGSLPSARLCLWGEDMTMWETILKDVGWQPLRAAIYNAQSSMAQPTKVNYTHKFKSFDTWWFEPNLLLRIYR